MFRSNDPFMQLSPRQVDELTRKMGEASRVPSIFLHYGGMANAPREIFDEWTTQMASEALTMQMIKEFVGEAASVVKLEEAGNVLRVFLVTDEDKKRIFREVMGDGWVL
mgnify:CR=1 FL=1